MGASLEGCQASERYAVLVGRAEGTWRAAQLAYAVSPIKLLAKGDPLFSWRDRMLKAFDNPHKAHGQKGFPESL